MTDNVADRKSVRAKEKAARIAAQKRANVIRTLMSTPDNREWVWDLLSRSHCFTTTFNGDALQSAFNEGQRANGLALLADILVTCPDLYTLAMQESNERYALDRINSDAAGATPERPSSEVPNGGDSGRPTGTTEDDGSGDEIFERPSETDDGRYDLSRH